VEASKASSGALNVTVERVDLAELLEQAQAEYAGRLMEHHLQPIVRVPDEDVMVWADGKYIWRILDNLLSNVCKYAMPNTRVYLELRTEDENAVLSVKNMSRESLNISAEELMERFVRGDASRNTEGSGLGLSIAQNLAKLIGGEVCITIDGDLFKADVLLPTAK
jgi:signal transduction histidine kinase